MLRSWTKGLLAWLALPLLFLLFELPGMLLPLPWHPSAELPLILALWLWAPRIAPRWRRLVYIVLSSVAAVLFLARVDRVVFVRFMGQEPLLYDQLFMLRHLFVLASDLWSVTTAAVVLGTAVGILFCAWSTRALLRVARTHFASRPALVPRAALALCALGALGSSPPVGNAPTFRFITPLLLDNLRESHRIYVSVQRQLGRSPYRDYRTLVLRRKPDVYLIFVESYGRVMAENRWLRPGYARRIQALQSAVSGAGWHAASAYTRAPIMGGRSWLAEGSVLTGLPLAYEAVFRQVISQVDRVPNLVSFLRGQGYSTLLLAPSDRKRTAVEEVNYYHYQKCVRFDDLGYRGPAIGWGIVPDQYSLFHTQENVLSVTPRPRYFEFHMVSSHAPWTELPQMVPDFHELGRGSGTDAETVKGELPRRMRRYVHWERRFAYLGELRAEMAGAYGQAITYELDVLERFLLGLHDDALVIVLGDHQPPFLAAETENFDTPLHVFARDPTLLDELRESGFVDGLWLGDTRSTAVRHEGLFSLLVRALVRSRGQGPPPPYLPRGADLGS
jgi:hypothetical protein